MKILFVFFIFLIFLGILEIYLISMLAGFIGNIWYAVAIIIVTGIIGALIARKNAKAAWNNLLKGDFRSSPPARQIFDTIAFFFAAALLILPGLITDILGILLLIPFIRNIIYTKISKSNFSQRSERTFQSHETHKSQERNNALGDDEVIDIEAEDI